MKPHLATLALLFLLLAPNPALPGDNSNWSSDFYRPGVTGTVQVLADFQNELIIGGSFNAVGPLPAANIARWNGSSWRTLGDGLSEPVDDMLVVDDQLIISGAFMRAGATDVDHVAVWDGCRWSPLGEGLPQSGPLIVYKDMLYCGSWRLEGDVWVDAIGAGGGILDMVIHDGLLAFGGNLDEFVGGGTGDVAAWDGEKVLNIWPGFGTRYKISLESFRGDLYAAQGHFAVTHNLYRWDGDQWVGIEGDCPYGAVTDLEVVDDKLYMATESSTIYVKSTTWGVTGKHLSHWDGSQWKTDIDFVGEAIYDILPHGDRMVVGGDFFAITKPAYLGGYLLASGIFIQGPCGPVSLVEGGLGAEDRVEMLLPGENELVVGGRFKTIGNLASPGVAAVEHADWRSRGLSLLSWPMGMGWHEGRLFCVPDTWIQYHDIIQLRYWDDGWKSINSLWFEGVAEYQNLCPTSTRLLQHGEDLLIPVQMGIRKIVKNQIDSHVLVTTEFLAEIEGDFGNTHVSSLCQWGNRLIAGGAFEAIDGVPAHNIAVYEDGLWLPMGDGADGDVDNIVEIGGVPYINVRHDIDSRTARSDIYRWNGSSWVLVVGDVEGSLTLGSYGGMLVAGGEFTSIGGVAANRIAVRHGDYWHPVDDGVNGRVYAVAEYDGALWVGGAFTRAGEKVAAGICCWRGPAVEVVMKDFSAERVEGGVRLSWELNESLYGVMRVVCDDGIGAERLVKEVPETSLMSFTHLDRQAPDIGVEYTLKLVYDERWSQDLASAEVPALTQPSRTRLGAPVPNPCNPSTTVEVEMADLEHVKLCVFDLRGRLVRTLHDGELPVGAHHLTWDGIRTDGKPAASGVYFVRMETPGRIWSEKVTLAR